MKRSGKYEISLQSQKMKSISWSYDFILSATYIASRKGFCLSLSFIKFEATQNSRDSTVVKWKWNLGGKSLTRVVVAAGKRRKSKLTFWNSPSLYSNDSRVSMNENCLRAGNRKKFSPQQFYFYRVSCCFLNGTTFHL